MLDCAVMVDKSSSGNPANSLIHDTANGCLISSFCKTQLLAAFWQKRYQLASQSLQVPCLNPSLSRS